MNLPLWCRECNFYYKGMTPEDYLYLQFCMRDNNKGDIPILLQKGELTLPPFDIRTKEDVFLLFGGDINYQFDIEAMC